MRTIVFALNHHQFQSWRKTNPQVENPQYIMWERQILGLDPAQTQVIILDGHHRGQGVDALWELKQRFPKDFDYTYLQGY